MNLILSYRHEHPTKSISTEIVCIEAESVQVVRDTIRTALREANFRNESYVALFGRELYLHDFFVFQAPGAAAYIAARAAQRSVPVPETVERHGGSYRFAAYAVMPLEDWFKKNAQQMPGAGLEEDSLEFLLEL